MNHSKLCALFSLLALSLQAYAGEIANRFLVFQIENPQPASECGRLKGFVNLVELVNDQMLVVSQFPTVYGLNGCNKQWRGDKKTPLGKYKINLINRKSLTNVSERNKFGGFSLVLDYPNQHDRMMGRTGDAIAIHGGRNSPTLGCARVLDGDRFEPSFGVDNIRRVAEFVGRGTPVIFAENAEPELVAPEGSYLSPEVAQFWKNVMLTDLSREDLANWIHNFRSYTTPVDPNAPVVSLTAASLATALAPGTITPIPNYPAATTTATVATPMPVTPVPVAAAMPVADVTPILEITGASESDVRVRVNSTLHGSSRYSGAKLLDNSDATAWCIEGSEKKKVVVFDYPETRTVSKLSIIAGYDRDNLWKQNSRPAEIKVTFDGGKTVHYDLKDTRNRQTFSFKPVKTKLVRVEVVRVRKGAKSSDMCISELEFH